LSAMIRAGCMLLGADKREFWVSPPPWARPQDENSEVITPEKRREEQAAAAVASRPAERRQRRSAYMG
jgi:hypothetical protein